MTTNPPKLAELQLEYEQEPSLLKGDSPGKEWLDIPVEFRDGDWGHAAKPNVIEDLGFNNPRKWSPEDEDWQLEEGWQKKVKNGMKERLDKFRSFKLFMDICVRCGACADKCHFFLGSGDPKNMPVVRQELMRSVYRHEFTWSGKIFKGLVGARPLSEEVLKEWFMYFHQCTECRRCSVYCPFGIDTAEVTLMGRELLNLAGTNINWISEPASNCNRTGNHLGIEPHTYKNVVESLAEDIEDQTGVTVNPSFNRKGAEILFITPSGDVFGDPGIYTMMGYMMLFEHIGLDYTLSTYASEGGNFGLFSQISR